MAAPMTQRLFSALKNGRLYSVTATAAKSQRTQVQSPPALEEMNGMNVMVFNEVAPVSRLTLAVKAGARNELLSEQGVTQVLRYLTGVGDSKSSANVRAQAMQWFAGGCSCSTTRELAYYSLEFIPVDTRYALANLAHSVSRDGIKASDWEKCGSLQSQLLKDLTYLESQPTLLMAELLHQAAFRTNLGNSLFSPSAAIGTLSTDEIMNFMNAMYTSDRMFLMSSGVPRSELSNLTATLQAASGDASQIAARSQAAKYYGGEQRQHYPNYDTAYVTLATEGASLNSESLFALEILKYALGTGARIKRAETMPGSKLENAVAAKTSAPFDVTGVTYSYSDAGLIGFTCAASTDNIKEVLKAARTEFLNVCKKGITQSDFDRAKSQLKAEMAMTGESVDNQLAKLAESILLKSKEAKTVDSLTLDDVNSVAKNLLKQKLTMSAVGNLSSTPFLEDL